MALTAEQQAEIELQEARDAGRRAHDQQMEATRQANALALAAQHTQANAEYQAKQIRLDAIRLAKETLIENARSKPVDAREVSAADVQAFAQTLVTYVNG